MKILISIISLVFLSNYATLAQDKNIFTDLSSYKSDEGKVIIFQDSETRLLIDEYIKQKKSEKGLFGYRIQIYFGSGHTAREEAHTIRNTFVSKYPEISAHVVFEEPNFKVRVGDFRSKSEALKVQSMIIIEPNYKGAFIVKDFIDWADYEKE